MPASARPRIAICGIHIESSTFTPYTSTAEDFEVRRGDAVIERYPFLAPGTELREAAEWIGVLHARALPGGQVDAASYGAWKQEIVEGLADAGHLDGILFDIHGAMSVIGLEDAEGDLITAIRARIGAAPVVSAPMDLHGNVSAILFEQTDLLTCYRTAPHVDVWETRERAAGNLLEALATGRVPAKALVHVPVLLPGEMTSTRLEPARSLYARIPEIEAREGIVDISCWIGFAWADQPRCQAAIVATGADPGTAGGAALELATAFWQARHEFAFVAPTGTIEDCLEQAIASSERPFYVSDSGDNPGAGGADDVTAALAAALARPEIRSGAVSVLHVSLVDPRSVAQAQQLGEGQVGGFLIGGHIDARGAGPIAATARVQMVRETDETGPAAVLRILDGSQGPLADTGMSVVVTARRTQFARDAMFTALDLRLDGTDLVIVKMGYLEPDLFAAQRGWLLALTPGGVDQDLVRLGHHRIERPMIPFDEDVPAPTSHEVSAVAGRSVDAAG